MRQLDCRGTGIKMLDLSPNPAMAFLFATECPALKTVYILEGADYSDGTWSTTHQPVPEIKQNQNK